MSQEPLTFKLAWGGAMVAALAGGIVSAVPWMRWALGLLAGSTLLSVFAAFLSHVPWALGLGVLQLAYAAWLARPIEAPAHVAP